MDIMGIHQLQVKTKVGVYQWEQCIEQTIIIDLELGIDIKKASESDNIEHTQNYVTLIQSIEEFLACHQFKLIESLTDKLAQHLLEKFKMPWLKLTVHKRPSLKNVKSATITVQRSQTTGNH